MIPPLREGHRAGVVPGIDHLGNPARLLSALGAREDDLVDRGAVRIEIREVPTSVRAELRERSDHREVHRRTSPDRQRRAPIAFPRERPVDVVLEPVAETPVTDVLGMPIDGVVHGEETLLHRGGADVPRGPRVIEERGLTAPAERVRVRDRPGAEQPAATREILDDRGVRVLDEQPADELRPEFGEPPVVPDGLEDRPALRAPHLQVRRPERRSEVHDPGPVLHRHEIARHDRVGTLDVGVGGLVAGSEQRPPAERSGLGSTRLRLRRRRRRPPPRAAPPRRCALASLPHRAARARRTRRRGPPRPRCSTGASRAWSSRRAGTRRRDRRRTPRRSGTGRRRSGPRPCRSRAPPRRRTAPCRSAGSTR